MAQIAYGGRKTREGTVVSDKMEKTIVVAVEATVKDRLYKKIVRRLRRYMVHDEANEASLGDRVRIAESRPYSRHKRWRLVDVLAQADRPEVAAEEIDLELLGEVKTEEEEAPPQPVIEEAEVAEVEAAAEEVPEAEEAAAEPVIEEAEVAEAEPEAEEAVEVEESEEVEEVEETEGEGKEEQSS